MKIFFIGIAFFINYCLLGQSIIHFSNLQTSPWTGSARYLSTGGALSALGNDGSSIMDNPANASIYRAGEFSISGLNQTITSDGLKQNLSIPQIHFGSAYDITGGVLSFSFDFRQSRWQPQPWRKFVTSPNYSMVDNWLDGTSNNTPEEVLGNGNYDIYGAYQAYILEFDSIQGSWYPLANGLPKNNLVTINREIVKNQFQFTGAIRIKNASIGYGLEFFNNKTMDGLSILESGFSPSGITSEFSMNSIDSAVSRGFRVRLGSVVKITRDLRWGAFWSSTSISKMQWKYRLLFNSKFFDYSDESYKIYRNEEFEIVNPQSFGTSLAYIFERKGFISAEYKYHPKIQTPIQNPITWSSVSDEISQELKGISELKTGAEIRNGIWSYRIGYRHSGNGSIYSDHSSFNQYSLGLGLRGISWNFDLALSHSTRNGNVNHPINYESWRINSSHTIFLATYSLRLR